MSELNVNYTNINTLSSADELEDGTNMELEDNTQQGETELIRGKRTRDENSSEEGWNLVSRGRSKLICSREQQVESRIEERTQVYVTCKEPLPKQFALARLFKTHNIASEKIYKIKYVHRNKILVTFDNEIAAEEFIKCSVFSDMGWSCQKTSEVGVSYGLIRAMELDISDEELKSNLSSNVEIVSIKRLNKRCSDDSEGNGWTPSETIRLGFQGPSLPPYVYIYSLRIPVERFVFPVTQCANCWKFGHLKISCPSKQPVCPKCSQKHHNCAATSFTCVNCSGDHMALDKICPYFKKEQKIRNIMSEFNCTYRKALTMYVPPSPVQAPRVAANLTSEGGLTYAEITKTTPLPEHGKNGTAHEIDCPDTATTNIRPKPKRNLKKPRRPVTPTPTEDILWHRNSEASDSTENSEIPLINKKKHSDKSLNNLSFWHLISKIRNIIRSKESLQIKIQQSISIFTEWIKQKIWNCQSIRPKSHSLELYLSQEKIHIAVLSETWLEPESSFRISEYNTYRLDREDGYGGVAIMTHRSVKSTVCTTQSRNPELSRAVAERRLALANLRRCPSSSNLDILKEKISTAQRLIRIARCKSFQRFCSSVDETSSASEMWRKMRWLKNRQVPNTSVDKEKAERLLKDLTPDFVNVSQYADDFVLYSTKSNLDLAFEELRSALRYTKMLIEKLGLTMSSSKTKICVFKRGCFRRSIKFDLDGTLIDVVNNVKYLGLWLDSSLRWVCLQWIPSHVQFEENDRVDMLAKQACVDGVPMNVTPLFSDYFRRAKNECFGLWQEYFDERSKEKGIWYRTIQPEIPRVPWIDCELNKTCITIALRLRSGHTPSNKFNYLMRKVPSPCCDSCGVVDDVLHILMECARNENTRLNIFGLQRSKDIGYCNSVLSSPMSDEAQHLYKLVISRS
ncbi:hypothetical protein HW555_009547 [Spodoptera exigua]|uniref:Reverse transcriptase n=1 Tax=Spodoptera exigua TaxID=7107 RepID=A0A835GB14_SPOEX|nr:hypothetical protein HW555_009547 [Spodoptera exigua]